MYTQCPECQTVFALTKMQLEARAGVVRCGKCAAIFQADEHLLDAPSERSFEQEEKSPQPTASDASDKTGASLLVPEDPEASLMAKPSDGRRRRLGWAFGNFLLLLALTGQYLFIYRSELAQQPLLAPWITEACALLACEIPPPKDIGKIELIEAEVAPHPKFDKALRISARLINHANFAQDYPLMEISLTNSNGVVLARRTFAPREYLEKPQKAAEGMAPNMTASALLEITQPDDSAVGYEIQLLASAS